MSPVRFKQVLKDNNVPMTNKLNVLIRRADAGDSKVTYHEFGSEIFKNYKDSSDATHFSRGEQLEPFALMKRAQSPDIKINRRYDHRPRDNLGTSGRVVGIEPYEGIKTEIVEKPVDNVEVYGLIKKERMDQLYAEDYPRNLMATQSFTKYVPKKGTETIV